MQDTNVGVRFGPAQDVNLYRQSSGMLKTDNSFNVAGNLQVGGAQQITGSLSVTGHNQRRSLAVTEVSLCRQHHGRRHAHEPDANHHATSCNHRATGGRHLRPAKCARCIVLRARLFSLVAGYFIFVPTVVYVGAAQQFTTLAAAITWAQAKLLVATLTVQGCDSKFSFSSPVLCA